MEDLNWGHYFIMWCFGFAGTLIWAVFTDFAIGDLKLNDYKWLAIFNTVLIFPLIVLFSF